MCPLAEPFSCQFFKLKSSVIPSKVQEAHVQLEAASQRHRAFIASARTPGPRPCLLSLPGVYPLSSILTPSMASCAHSVEQVPMAGAVTGADAGSSCSLLCSWCSPGASDLVPGAVERMRN